MKRFSKRNFSIPNLMGYFRILLIPVFCYLYITAETEREYLCSAGCSALQPDRSV